MNQFQYDVIIKVISSGAPALANELCTSLSDLVNDRNALAKENEELKSKIEESKCVKELPVKETPKK